MQICLKKTSSWLKHNKWLLGDFQCILQLATDGPIQLSTHLSVSSSSACVCVWVCELNILLCSLCSHSYTVAVSLLLFLLRSKWRWKLQFSRRINLLRFYLHACGLYTKCETESFQCLYILRYIARFILFYVFLFCFVFVRFGFGFHSHNSIWDLIMNSKSIHRIMGKEIGLC